MTEDLEKITVELTEEYYNNRPKKFFDYMHNDIVWIGPGIAQYIEGKQSLLDAFSEEKNTLLFRTSEMSSKTIKGESINTREVLLRYSVHTYYPSGNIDTHHQRVTYFWKKTKVNNELVWRYALIHISNGMETDERDNFFPIHFDEFHQKRFRHNFTNLDKQQRERLIAKGYDGSTYYIEFSEIEHIAAGKGKFCYIYTRNNIICVRQLLDQLIKILPDEFYRPHRSYIINILQVVKLSRNQIILKNNTSIPIPPKKYNQVASDIEQLLKEKEE